MPFGFVEAVAVVEEAGFGVGGFGGEAVWVGLGEGAGGAGGFAEGAVFVLGTDRSGGGVDERGDVAVAIVTGVMGAACCVDDGKEGTDSAGVLAGLSALGGDIEAPDVALTEDGGGGACGLQHGSTIPTAVDVLLCLQGNGAGSGGEGAGLEKTAERIIGMLKAAVGRSGGDGSGGACGSFHAIFSIPKVSPFPVVRQVPIQIVGGGEGGGRNVEIPGCCYAVVSNGHALPNAVCAGICGGDVGTEVGVLECGGGAVDGDGAAC